MATHEAAAEAPAEQPAEAHSPGKLAKLMPMITMLGVVLAVVTVECLTAYFYIPSADDLAAAAGASIAAEAPPPPVEEEPEEAAAGRSRYGRVSHHGPAAAHQHQPAHRLQAIRHGN